ncbi:VacJ family lipoprotein [Aquabacterium sp.]|uniref:MlaA family lipoprotein n=1 Tax=Aquabacterium sp. TaxID=1872578 RepID=UPI0025BADCEC|nr:VacJ family lipoprotein [Aquabacterium sp.]
MNSKKTALLLGLVLAGALQGCATRQNPDPLEPWNRKVFSFNESLDANVLKPVAEGYKAVTPEPVRTAFTNFVSNLKDVWSTANLFLQGRFKDGTLGVIRVTVNSTFGLGGLIDIATPMQLYRSNEDFGQTLGVWGVKPGAYIVWPLLGSSTLRDSVGIPGDLYFSPSTLGTYPREVNLLRAFQLVNARANYLSATNLVDDVALDKYSFVRDAYLQRRQNLIYEGDPPEEDELDDPSQPDNAAPPAAGASEAGAASAPDAPVKTSQTESAENPWAMFP